MRVENIIEKIESFAPVKFASDWDNVGLMIGSINASVRKILLALDVTSKTVNEAIANGCDMIISHHPLFFKGCKSLDFNTSMGSIVEKLIKNNITVYSCHTNMDCTNGGINTYLAEMFGLKNLEVLEPNEACANVGIGRIGSVDGGISINDLCEFAKKKLNTPGVRLVTSDNNRVITRLCVASGSCGDLISLAYKKGAEAIITADVKYHEALDALEMGIDVIDAGHFPTEFCVTQILADLLKSMSVELIVSDSCDVFKFV